ncbi:PREDICTED: trimethyllysine dioxygenase, mitochondrial-like [Branchiostoma belcheri]|uniref:Trimethyllysine dioxygenase, mitochondrial n=1 Tax=Branchiostoma belcheri TaxID=7741 RepID=A0A6P4ZDE5_BRABE|nr:PREDICTED: trimethyllysine dioxygenase, mitochondrial-like [Branchiostoma belcheri]XP_019634718.1 PREDICTED: trimethyllysine dioxygenase, mitochondrial-like [Branchiostoma belcheri]XP_019634720.1 PREDICTED: trimethyllysine dioxygenase, mitochondrial-like [Branchiostoma belcheri]
MHLKSLAASFATRISQQSASVSRNITAQRYAHMQTFPKLCSIRHARLLTPTQSVLASRTRLLSTSTCVKSRSHIEKKATGVPVSVTKFVQHEDHLELEVKGAKLKLNYVWLRDHCRTGDSINHLTQQRMVDTFLIEPDIQPVNVAIQEGTLNLTWPDGHQSEYELDWLLSNTYEGKQHIQTTWEPLLWNVETLSASPKPSVLYQDYLSDDEQLAKLLHYLLKYGFAFVEEAPVTLEATLAAAERICQIRETFFGRFWCFTSDLERHDTAYTAEALGAHTDTTYLNEPSGVQVFHKMEHVGEGGATLLVDGFHAAERLRREDPEGFDILSSVSVPHHYLEPGVHTTGVGPVLELEPGAGKELKLIRYNMHDRACLDTVPMEDVSRWYSALRKLTRFIRDPASEYWVPLKPGQILLTYNWRVLHGRSAFTGRRRVSGCYLPRDDVISRARVLKVI